MTETFVHLFGQQLQDIDDKIGYTLEAKVVRVERDRVVLDAGLKSDAIVPIAQFTDERGEIEVKEGDLASVVVDSIDDGHGSTQLSREKAKRVETMKIIEDALENGTILEGLVTNKIRGGYHVSIGQVRAFLPGSLADVRPARELVGLEGQLIQFKVMSIDHDKNNILISRKAVLEIANLQERAKKLESLKVGSVVKGVIKNMTNYGAFVDLGQVDGLLHNSDISWRRTRHPSEILELGQDVEVKVLSFDTEAARVSLGMKQLTDDPWIGVADKFTVNNICKATVTNLADYGFFAEIASGIEGLVHVSEISWKNKNIHPSKVVQIGQEVEVMILDLDASSRRLSLGMKQCTQNPWEEFSNKYKVGDKVKGTINSITDFGVFIGLDVGVDGLLHNSDISWNPNDKTTLQSFKKSDEVETVISSIDIDRERISLSIKMLNPDDLGLFMQEHEVGSAVKGTITGIDGKSYIVKLNDKLDGVLRFSELSDDESKAALEVNSEVEAKIVFVDHKKRIVFLSMKDKDRENKREQVKFMEKLQEQNKQSSSMLGDLLKDSLAQAKDSSK